jgi:hypothetical protein
MNLDRASGTLRGTRLVLAALAILSVFALAAPSATAGVSLSFNATDVGTSTSLGVTALSSGTSDSFTLGNFGDADDPVTVTATASDKKAGSKLTSTTITLKNTTKSGTDTLDLLVTGTGYTVGGLALPGLHILSKFSVGGSGGPTDTTTDKTTAKSWVDLTNTAFGTGSPLGSLITVPKTTDPLNSDYTSGASIPKSLKLTGTMFSFTQELDITLKAGDQANLTIITAAIPTPEPSSMALAGLGALGLIGYGIRRRRGA